MRVLHVMPSIARDFGGPTEALLGYLEAGRHAGIAADVVAPVCAPEDEHRFVARAGDAVVTSFPLVGRGALAASPAMLRWLGEQASGYDVVHVHGLLNLVSSLAARWCAHAGVPYVVRPFGTLSRYTFTHRRGAAKRLYLRALDAPSLQRAGAVHYTTEEERDEAEWHGLGLAARGHVVAPPWVAPARAPERDASRPGRRVLFLSRLHPKKGIELLLDAWPAVRARVPDAELVVAGSGDRDYTTRLEARVMHCGEGDSKVSFAGFVTAGPKADCFAAADCFVLPSFHENFGVAVLEAIASGLPVVVSPDVQLAAFVQAHRLGEVAPREPGALADSLVRVLGDAELRARCAREGPALVSARFSPEAVGRGLRAMYEAASSRAGAPEPATLQAG
jgi:glycosyltransferase involved in cell wall biosynthesis